MVRIALVLFLLALGAPGSARADSPGPGCSFFNDDGNLHESAIEAIGMEGITRGCGEPEVHCSEALATGPGPHLRATSGVSFRPRA